MMPTDSIRKLTRRQQMEIRFHYAAGHATQSQLADQYGVSTSWVSIIVNRKSADRAKAYEHVRVASGDSRRWQRRYYHEGSQKTRAQKRVSWMKATSKRSGWAEPLIDAPALEAMLADAAGCKICGKLFEGVKNHVDHCHVTGVVRGILCPQCNHMLGMAKDDPAVLRNAATYLEETR